MIHTPEPTKDAGIEAIRLDADRTRDELEQTLDAIEEKLDPRRVVDSLTRAYRNRPVEFVAVATGVLGAVIGLVVWRVVATRGHG